jgi:hypothetical protein
MTKLFALVAVAALAATAACDTKDAQETPPVETATPGTEPAAPVVVDPAAPVVVDPNAPTAPNDSLAATTPLPAESATVAP